MAGSSRGDLQPDNQACESHEGVIRQKHVSLHEYNAISSSACNGHSRSEGGKVNVIWLLHVGNAGTQRFRIRDPCSAEVVILMYDGSTPRCDALHDCCLADT